MSSRVEYDLERDIPFSEIDTDSEEYCLEYTVCREDIDELEQCRRYHCFYPPILLYKDACYKPVYGKRFIQIYRDLSNTLPYGLIIRKHFNSSYFLYFLAFLKKQMAGFNWVEKAIALKKAHDLDSEIGSELLALLEVPKNKMIINRLILLATAPDAIKRAVVKGMLDRTTAFEIFRFHSSEWERLLHFILAIALGTKKRNRLLNMIYEISQRDQKQVSYLIENDEIKRIFAQNIDPPHKGERVYAYFFQQRYPVIHQYRERFNKKLKEVGIGSTFHLITPMDFEKWEFKLIVPFGSVGDFKEKVEKMKAIGDTASFRELMEMRY